MFLQESTDFADHARVKEFETNYKTASAQEYEVSLYFYCVTSILNVFVCMHLTPFVFVLQKTRNKAVGETIILFHYLFESCSAKMWLWALQRSIAIYFFFNIQSIIY